MSDEKSIDSMTVAELEEVAAAHGIDLSAASNKAEKLEAVRAGLAGDDAGQGSGSDETPDATRLDEAVDRPSTTAPGDGPADTTDPTEHASTVNPDKAAAAKAGHGTVNTVVPVPRPGGSRRKASKERIEQYERTRPDGKVVTVEHNLETGKTSIVGVRDADDD